MTNKLKYFVGNWKMFGDFNSIKIINQINHFCSNFKKKGAKSKVIICVPHTLIFSFVNKFKNKLVSIGAQNCHHHNGQGSFTGSISSLMIRKCGARYIILGHSESRSDGDTNKLINKKIEASLNEKINVIFCIGETLHEKKTGKTFSILRKQIRDSISKKFNLNKIIIAYEPIWSIGTGKVPKTYELIKIFEFIKSEYKRNFKIKKFPIVLYGGSVNSNNIQQFAMIPAIDGFLIGGASQSSKKFIDIIKNYYK